MSSTNRIALAAALLTLGIGAGTSLAGPPPADDKPVKLTIGTTEPADRPAAQMIDVFAARVNALSQGRVRVETVYEAGKTYDSIPTKELEARLIALVRTGELDFALVPTRAWQAQGVTTFQGLQAPFLITSDALAAKATSGPIAMQMLAGLRKLNLTGLAMVNEGLRRPFGFKKALVRPADFKGATIRAIPSKPTWDLLRAIGAKPVDLNGNAYQEAVDKGMVQAVESSLALNFAPFTASNIVFFPKINAVVANNAVSKGLDAAAAASVRKAALQTRAWALANLTEQRARVEYCKYNTIVAAPPAAVRALEAMTAPMLAEMRRDPLARRLIDEVRAAKSSPSGVAACNVSATKRASKDAALIPRGVYRRSRVTEAELLAAGASPGEARGNSGILTLTVSSGGVQRLRFDTDRPEYAATCDARKMYRWKGLVAIDLRGACGGDIAVAWKRTSDGIRFTRVVPNAPVLRLLFMSRAWKRVG
jgi:TRAP-type C4-dicarboxylate transport system substrate-binding protein